MFSLVRFHSDKFSVLKTTNVQKLKSNTCIVKCNGGKYSAFLVARNDDKSKLLDVKRVKEEKLSIQLKPKNKSSLKSDANVNKRSLKSKKSANFHTKNKSSEDINSNEIPSVAGSKVLLKNSLPQTEHKPLEIKTLIYNDKDTKLENTINPVRNTTLEKIIKPDSFIDLNSVHQDATYVGEYSPNLSSSTSNVENSKSVTDHVERINVIDVKDIDTSIENNSILSNDTTTIQQHKTTATEISLKSESYLDLSSVNHGASTISEYIPDLSASTSQGIFDNSEGIVNQDESVNIVDAPINVKNVVVPYSKSETKKHFCIFCKQLQCKIARHFYLKHKNEIEIKQAIAMPKRSKERLKIIEKLRKQGDFEHNTSANHNTGVLIVSRRQQIKCKNNADDYICCKSCKGFFSKRTIRIHLSVCANSKGKRSNFTESRRLTQYTHSVASKMLRTEILPVLRNDEITKAIRYDELVIKFGNKLADKYSSKHQHDMIRANLRLLGRFMIEIKKLDPDIKELKEIFKPNLFDKCVVALRIVANWDDTKMWFNTPAVAQNLTSLIKKCGKKQRAELIKDGCEELKTKLENFLLLWEEEIPTLINKKALEDQTNQKRVKKIILPSKEDIKKLYVYMKEKIIHAIEKLSQAFCISTWTELVQSTLIFLQIFNRRRAGEIERLTIENFQNKEVITDNIDKDILNNISKESLRFAKQFVRISLRGKLGRTVSVLLCPMCVKAIDLILKFRKDAGIATENKYIFSKLTSSKLMKPYYRACPLLKMFSEECGAQIPESLRGTTLRKHIATYTSLLNVEEATVDRLANFMGHHKDIHKNIYRMSIPVAEVTCISKLLMSAVGDEQENEDNEDESQNENVQSIDNNLSDRSETPEKQSSSSKKRRSTSPFGKTKRCRWSTAERNAINSIFGNLSSLTQLPSLQQCINAIQESPALCNRTPQQIKSWIDNQRRYKRNINSDSTI